MSDGIALVVLRFELVDWSEKPLFLYNAPDFQLAMEQPTEEDFQKYSNSDELRGSRQIEDIQIETVTFKARESGGSAEGGAEGAESMSPRSDDSESLRKLSPRQSQPRHDEAQPSCSYAAAVTGRWSSEEAITRGSPDGQGDSKSTRPKSSTPKLPNSIDFYCGNPSVERVQGILHLFKDNKKTSMEEEASRSELICMLSVPASFTLHDLLQFTDHVYEGIEYMKIIRDLSPNHYMVLIKFQTQRLADEFYNNYNDTPFNSIEPDVCHLVYVARVDFMKDSEGGAVPIPGLVELPSCPVCLERMDESVDGILTILCNHAFHSTCLKKWGDTSCPVCRYSQTPEQTGENHCFECNCTESLWICLICGQVGCGRYVDGHAYRHFERTNHTYAMQLSNGRVWDYVGDNYVHRLIQNKEDGKLVEMDERGQRVTDEKLDSLTLEYTYLLTKQLDSQRRYFEEKLTSLELECEERIAKSEELHSALLQNRSSEQHDTQLVLKKKEHAEKKCEQLSTQLKKALTQLQDEQALNKSLLNNQQHWQYTIQKSEEEKQRMEKKLEEMQEQLRDVLFHMEAQNKLSESSSVDQKELEDGQIEVGPSAAASRQQGRRARKKK